MQKASEERGLRLFSFCFVLTSCCDNCKYVSEAFLSLQPEKAGQIMHVNGAYGQQFC